MKLLPDQDERDLGATLRALLAAECPTSVVRRLRDCPDEGIPDQLWTALVKAGVFGLSLPTEYGGAGGDLSVLGVFYVEAGRALCPTIVHSTVQAALAIDVLGGAAHRAAWLPGLAAGTTRATTSLFSPRDAAVLAPELSARPDADGGWRLTGRADFVLDADFADLLVVTAAHDEKILGFIVDTGAAGVDLKPLPVLGGYRVFQVNFADVRVADPRAVLTGPHGPHGQGLPEDALRRVANTAMALLSLDLVGVGEAVLQRTVEYTKAREQFGRPIASFQAAQHLVANMHIALAAARLAGHSAVFWVGDRDTTWETAIARMHAATAAKLITLDAHQLHGGMGYVLETDLHLFSERARVLSTLGGGADIAAAWLSSESPYRMAPTEDEKRW